MIFAYNKEQVGDVLLVILEDTKDIKRSVERKGKVARVTADETGQTLASVSYTHLTLPTKRIV